MRSSDRHTRHDTRTTDCLHSAGAAGSVVASTGAGAAKPSGFVDPDGPLLTVRQIAQKYPAFTEDSVRWAIFCARSRGSSAAPNHYAELRPALIRLGRRVLIDERRFLRWVRGASR